MNKQRYLAELRRLLVFMSDEDRDEAVRRCGEAFDAAGPEGEAVLIAEMGSPTKMAIQLSRGYEAGKIPDVIPKPVVARPAPVEAPAAGTPAVEELLPPEPQVTWTEMPAFDPSAAEAAEAKTDGTAGEPAKPETESAPEETPAEPGAGTPPAPAEPAPEPEPSPEGPHGWKNETPAPAAEARTVVERSMPLGLGIPLFILVFGALGIPLGLLCLALSLVLLCPGCAILFGAYLIGVGGLWCTAYMADAVLLFGAAFIVLAVGLLALWLGIWLAVKLFTAYGKGVGWIAGELLGRKVTTDA